MADAVAFLPSVTTGWLRKSPQRRWKTVDGALVFVDVSGFTAMSERLAVLGREGAERVTDIIDDAFTELLEVAHGQGASLLKFGGDALLLAFDGEGAPVRAAHSAYEMRATLQRVGRVETPAGPVRLAMSAGVHAGSIDLFLVGTSHRELFVVGPSATTVVETEGAAGSGNVLLSQACAARLPDHVVGSAHGPGQLLVASPAVPPPSAQAARAASPSDWRAVPAGLRRHLVDDGRDRAEHRHAVVGFVHFDGTDVLLVDRGHEATADALEELVAVVQTAADRRGVCVLSSDVDADGGKMILTAGVPVAHGDDVDRLLLVAREIVDAATTIPVRIGVHHGPLFAGEIGPAHRRTYTVMGDVVNTAARVMSRADPGQVLATNETIEASDLTFEATAIAPFAVKGKAAPLLASVVGAPQVEITSLAEQTGTELVGRDEELRELLRRLDAAVDGRGAIVELLGPPGVGKTELVRALYRARSEVAVVVLRGAESTKDVPYWPVQAAIRSVLGVAPDASVDVLQKAVAGAADGLGVRPSGRRAIEVALGLVERGGSDADPSAFRADLAASIDQLLQGIDADGLLLVVDNAQWIDGASAALVQAVAGSARHRRRLVVTTSRRSEASFGGTVLPVEPLDEFHATELARVVSHFTLLPPAANAIARRAEGNPLFVRELVEAVRADDVSAGGDIDGDALPHSLEQILVARIDRLAPADRAVLRQLAIHGVEADPADVIPLVGADPDEAAATLERLADYVVVNEGTGSIRFRETLVVDAACAGLSYRRRRMLHQTAGEHLEQRLTDPERRAEVLSRHFAEAGDHARTWRYATVAGQRASAQASFAEAAVHFERGISAARLLRSVPEPARAKTWRDLGYARMVTGDLDGARRSFQRASRLAVDPELRARIALDRGQLASDTSRPADAVRWYRRSRREVDHGDMLARSLLGEAAVRFGQGRLEVAEGLARDAMNHAGDADERLLANISSWRFQIAAKRRSADAAEHGRRAIEVFERLGIRRHLADVHNAMSSFLFDTGEWRDAVDHARRAVDVLDELGVPTEAAIARFNLSSHLFQMGRLGDARMSLEVARNVFALVGHPFVHVVDGVLAAVTLAEGCGEDADPTYHGAMTALDEAGLGGLAEAAHVLWAEAAASVGGGPRLAAVVDVLARSTDREVEVRLPRLRAVVALHDGDIDSAAEIADVAVAVTRGVGDPHQLSLALDVRAQVSRARGDDGYDDTAEAASLRQGLGITAGRRSAGELDE